MENTNQGTNDQSKVKKKFEENLAILDSILGKANAGTLLSSKKSRLPNNSLQAIVDKLTKAKEEAAMAKFEVGLSSLIEKNVEFNTFKAKKQADMDKAIEEQQKILNTEFDALFQQLSEIKDIRANAGKVVSQLAGGTGEEVSTDNS